MDEVTLTALEARMVRSIVVNWIGEMGSIFNDPARLDEENELRRKLGIDEMKPGE
jgi:hypothetical protein